MCSLLKLGSCLCLCSVAITRYLRLANLQGEKTQLTVLKSGKFRVMPMSFLGTLQSASVYRKADITWYKECVQEPSQLC